MADVMLDIPRPVDAVVLLQLNLVQVRLHPSKSGRYPHGTGPSSGCTLPASLVGALTISIAHLRCGIGTNAVTNFHEGVLTRINSPLPGGHVFQTNRNQFELVQDIIGTNLLTEIHEYQTINPCYSTNWNHFEQIQDFICTNALTKFHKNQIINVASRVLKGK
ncbi:hypothetical protein DPMN_177421 [Dreissena polymorpha]|uniref:Uncharacterized protein n=1 Tax=Dreissena polymorpha TaxID=45954 RepID=A0A9D4ED06_DREPO|nr:hypothetical protein DPMN_177421 [Dreissena polymorpha]